MTKGVHETENKWFASYIALQATYTKGYNVCRQGGRIVPTLRVSS